MLMRNADSLCDVSKNQVLREIAYFQRYLTSIEDNVLKRKDMLDTFKRIASQRNTASHWTADSEVNLKELRRKLMKVTKKQIRDFGIIREEIT